LNMLSIISQSHYHNYAGKTTEFSKLNPTIYVADLRCSNDLITNYITLSITSDPQFKSRLIFRLPIITVTG